MILLVLSGCAAPSQTDTLYERMTAAALPASGLQQVHLAHIGHIETDGGRYEVCVQRLVITGMMVPRGQMHLLLFTPEGQLARDYDYPAFKMSRFGVKAARFIVWLSLSARNSVRSERCAFRSRRRCGFGECDQFFSRDWQPSDGSKDEVWKFRWDYARRER
jgi:hypothetical protein